MRACFEQRYNWDFAKIKNQPWHHDQNSELRQYSFLIFTAKNILEYHKEVQNVKVGKIQTHIKCVVCINLRGNSLSFWTTVFGREHNQWLFLCFFLKFYLSQTIDFTAHNYHKTMTGFHLSHLFQSLAWRVGAWATCTLIIISIL